MKNKLKYFGILALLLIGQLIHGQSTEKELVIKSFENYKKAILNDNGDEAVKYVDSRTIKYYCEILYLVKTADSTKVETLSMLDKLLVFFVRHRISREDILSFDGKSLLVYVIKNGMVGKNGVSKYSIDDVTIIDKFSKGQFSANGKKAPFYLHFYKEDEQWKIDLTSLFPLSTMVFKMLVGETTELILSFLEMATGKKPNHEIWEPID